MNNQRLMSLGLRIKEAQARVEAMQQQIQTILKEKEADYRETAEDTGTVKCTAEGLYDYGYNPIDEDIPF